VKTAKVQSAMFCDVIVIYIQISARHDNMERISGRSYKSCLRQDLSHSQEFPSTPVYIYEPVHITAELTLRSVYPSTGGSEWERRDQPMWGLQGKTVVRGEGLLSPAASLNARLLAVPDGTPLRAFLVARDLIFATTWAGVILLSLERRYAASPATCGVDTDVPESRLVLFGAPIQAEGMSRPGANTSMTGPKF
jgi:hypothetical protein